MKEELKDVLLNARKKKGYSRRELAEKAHVSEMSIRRYENGERIPNYVAMIRLQRALDLDLVTTDAKKMDISLAEYGAQLGNVEEEYLDYKTISAKANTDNMLYIWNHLNLEGKAKAYDLMCLVAKIPEYFWDDYFNEQEGDS